MYLWMQSENRCRYTTHIVSDNSDKETLDTRDRSVLCLLAEIVTIYIYICVTSDLLVRDGWICARQFKTTVSYLICKRFPISIFLKLSFGSNLVVEIYNSPINNNRRGKQPILHVNTRIQIDSVLVSSIHIQRGRRSCASSNWRTIDVL